MLQIFLKYSNRVDFLTVYVCEAHATDEWKLGNRVKIPQHQSLNDRISAAKLFESENDYQIPLVVDSMDNDFDTTYSAWPERGYIIYQRHMEYISNADITGAINWEEGVEKWLQHHFNK